MKHRIVFLDDEGIGPDVRVPKLPFEHPWVSHRYTRPEQVVEHLRGASVALTCSVPLREEHLAQLPDLRMITLALTGTDIVDLDYCRAHGIKVSNVPGYATYSVAEHAVAMMFELFRKVSSYSRLMQRVRSGAAEPRNIYFDYPIRDLRGRVLGIVGNGPIGKRVAELGGHLRTGLEDTFYLPDGTKADSNGPLIEKLAEYARNAGREVASPQEARGMLGLKAANTP